ncbi:NADPH-dependent FMN reductase [Streptomyces sp. NPDC002078]
MEFFEIPIKDLPLYSYDYDSDYPAEGKALKDAIASADALLFVTPEYNRALGTALAQQSLRGVLSFCDSPQMNAPEAYVRFKPDVFTDDGEVVDEHTERFLRDFMEEFRDHVVRVLTVRPRKS